MWLCAHDYTVRLDYFKTVGKGKICRGWDLWKSTNIHLLHRQESKSIKQDVKPPAEVVRTCWNRPRLQQRASCSINCAVWEQPENRVSQTPSTTLGQNHKQGKVIHLYNLSFAIEKSGMNAAIKSFIRLTFSALHYILFTAQGQCAARDSIMERHFVRSV